jgi:hypothetical protein
VVSITTEVVAVSIFKLVRNLLSNGSLEAQTAQLHPIKGTPVLVPEPKMVKCNNAI